MSSVLWVVGVVVEGCRHMLAINFLDSLLREKWLALNRSPDTHLMSAVKQLFHAAKHI